MKLLYDSFFKKMPPKIICVGKNYANHVKEMGGTTLPKSPVLFLKPHSSLIHSKHITLDFTNEIHYELELGIIFKKGGKDLDPKKWRNFVGGYFIGLDITDRTLQHEAKKNSLPWTLSKGKDNFLPCSNFIDPDMILNPNNLELILNINGNKVQHGFTKDMIFNVPTLIEFISKNMTICEGDMLLTGTPEGVGKIEKGDIISGTLKQESQVLTETYWEFS